MEMRRAYSLLTQKSVDGDVVRGIATTPTTDRMGDIVVPTGVVYRSKDYKLLMHHDSRLPVGTVKFGKATDEGIAFVATLPRIAEAGVVRDRVEEARHSIQYGLISAVSIGFMPLEDGVEYMEESGGLRFTKWEMVELSLTATPANPDAVINVERALQADGRLSAAAVSTLKSLDRLARQGRPVQLIAPERRSTIPAGAVQLLGRAAR